MKRVIDDRKAAEIYSVFAGFAERLQEQYDSEDFYLDEERVAPLAVELTKVYFGLEEKKEEVKPITSLAEHKVVEHAPETGYKNGVLKL
jgi:hypothetical protein